MGSSERESLHILTKALAKSPHKVAIHDPDMELLLWAGGGWEGITKPEFWGRRWLEFVHPLDAEALDLWRKNPRKKSVKARWIWPPGWAWIAMSKRKVGPFWVVLSQVGPADCDLKLCWECLKMVDGRAGCGDSTVQCPYRLARA